MAKDDGGGPWIAEIPTGLIGRIVLVGLTYYRATGGVDRQTQFHGAIIAVDPDAGITMTGRGRQKGETLVLPPQIDSFERAAPGTYTLKASGEEVEDPDYLCEWSIHPPAPAA